MLRSYRPCRSPTRTCRSPAAFLAAPRLSAAAFLAAPRLSAAAFRSAYCRAYSCCPPPRARLPNFSAPAAAAHHRACCCSTPPRLQMSHVAMPVATVLIPPCRECVVALPAVPPAACLPTSDYFFLHLLLSPLIYCSMLSEFLLRLDAEGWAIDFDAWVFVVTLHPRS
ncbi:unnamed protein product [Closterium sp. NIES-54]